MSQKSKGMGANPLARREAAAPRRGSGLVGAVPETGDSSPSTVPLVDLAQNPDNPEDRVATEGLVASVGQVGVLVPLTVTRASEFVAAHPEHAEAVGERPWVILAGHCRADAAAQNSLAEVPVYVVELGDRAGEVLLVENMHRTALTPIQEAVAYQRNLERTGLSQRKLAEHLGVPQSQISKRVSLLTLPEVLHPMIASGELELETAQELVAPLKEARVREIFLSELPDKPEVFRVRSTVRSAELKHQAELRVEAGRAVAEAEGLPFVEDPEKEWRDYYNRRLTTKKDVAAARKAGTLVVGPMTQYDDEPQFYTSAPPKKSSGSVRSEAERAETKAREASRKARREFLVGLPAGVLSRSAERWTREVVLGGLSLGSNATTQARKLAQGRGVGPEVVEDWPWRTACEELEDKDAKAVAAVVVVSLMAGLLEDPHQTRWSARACRFMEWLIEVGYTPTEWENQRLKVSQVERVSGSDSVGDSAESVDAGEDGEA